LGGRLTPQAAEIALDRYFSLAIVRHETSPLAARVWQLRHQFTSYDASYLALAEALDVPLHTCDAKLATNGHRAVVQVMGRSNS
ncbi:MAG TPA: type II toxin-antitoxin system VapC family toxin, partial [Arachnia sp.]|nr:type II toxin-antitoxin system VapC family toxin [Arachnia sp.]